MENPNDSALAQLQHDWPLWEVWVVPRAVGWRRAASPASPSAGVPARRPDFCSAAPPTSCTARHAGSERAVPAWSSRCGTDGRAADRSMLRVEPGRPGRRAGRHRPGFGDEGRGATAPIRSMARRFGPRTVRAATLSGFMMEIDDSQEPMIGRHQMTAGYELLS